MGIEDRDGYRDNTRQAGRGWQVPGVLIVVALIGGLVLAAGTRYVAQRKQPTFEGAHRTVPGDTKVSLLPGLPPITLTTRPPFGSTSSEPAESPAYESETPE